MLRKAVYVIVIRSASSKQMPIPITDENQRVPLEALCTPTWITNPH